MKYLIKGMTNSNEFTEQTSSSHSKVYISSMKASSFFWGGGGQKNPFQTSNVFLEYMFSFWNKCLWSMMKDTLEKVNNNVLKICQV